MARVATIGLCIHWKWISRVGILNAENGFWREAEFFVSFDADIAFKLDFAGETKNQMRRDAVRIADNCVDYFNAITH